jgi:Protein of unknown function (DUF2818)
MTTTAAVWFLIGLAFLLANLPFLMAPLFGIYKLKAPKSLWLKLLELLGFYLLTGLVGWLIERRVGQATVQGWEFYAITFALFLTFAFPGFVYAHLWRRNA